MSSDLHADDEALSSIARVIRSAGDRVGELGTALPATPDAGDATPIVNTVLANLLTGAGELTEIAAGLWSGVEESRTAYRGVEGDVVNELNRANAGPQA